jgi:hypothetical protein
MDVIAFQELLHGAEATGTGIDTVNHTLGKLSRTMFEAGEGNKQAADSFKKLGINTKDASGKLRPTQDVLYEISDKFKDMPDGAERAALAMRLFSRGGIEAVPWLSRGSEKLKEFSAGATRAGVIIDKETIKIAKEFKLAKHEFKETFEGLATRIGSRMLPSLTSMAKGIANVAEKMQPFMQMMAGHYIDEWMNSLRMVAMVLSPITNAVEGVVNAISKMNTTMGASSPVMTGILNGFKMLLSPITTAYTALEDLFRFATGKSSALGLSMAKDPLAYAKASRAGKTFKPFSGDVEGEPGAPNKPYDRSIYGVGRRLVDEGTSGVGEMVKGIEGGRYWKTWLEGTKLGMGISSPEEAAVNMPWATPWRGMAPEDPLGGVPSSLARPGSWETPVKVDGSVKVDITIDASGVVHKTEKSELRQAAETVHGH